jgi:acyl dehydratase
MAFVLYLCVVCAVSLAFTVRSLLPLVPLLSFQPCTSLRFAPNKLSGLQITVVVLFLFFKPVLQQLGFVPGLTHARVKGSLARNEDAFHLPDVRLEMPVIVSRADMESYERATCATNTASPTSGANSLFLLSPVTAPLMLLLLARPACPILPLGSMNVRNRFEFISPGECKNVSLRTRLRAEASLRRKGRRVKRGVEFDVVIEVFGEDTEELIFRQVMTILQFLNQMVEPTWLESQQTDSRSLLSPPEKAYSTIAKETLAIHEDSPSKWAALCKDYNPIHISALAARLFGFTGKIAHGNQAAAMMVERLASHAQSSTQGLWRHSSRASFMDVEFRRPMVVPLQLGVLTADKTTAQRSKKSDEALQISPKQIVAWAVKGELPEKVHQAAKAYYQQVCDANAMKDRKQEAVMAGCIFIACRDCDIPRTFSEIYSFTRVPKKEIGAVYKTLERFLSDANTETLQYFRLEMKRKVYVEGRIGWLRQK